MLAESNRELTRLHMEDAFLGLLLPRYRSVLN